MFLGCFVLISYFSLNFCSMRKKRYYFTHKKTEVVCSVKRLTKDIRGLVKKENVVKMFFGKLG